MQTPILAKLTRLGNSLAIVIPREILKNYNLQRGDHVLFYCTHDKYFVVSLVEFVSEMPQDLPVIE